MIQQLDIRNYAIIDAVSLQFSPNLNIITGETGSGKSILLGALGLILGNRADTKVLSDKSKKCVIEGTFDIRAYELKPFFDQENLDYSDLVIIRREINPAGKSRAFINDTPVTLKQLQSLTNQLVDLHQQFENLGIVQATEQLRMLDALAQNGTLLQEYQRDYRTYRQLAKQLETKQEENAEALRQRDYIEFQLQELLDLEINPEKDQTLEERLDSMEHAEEIIRTTSATAYALTDSEDALFAQLLTLQQRLSEIATFHAPARDLSNRLQSVGIELEDIAQEANQMAEAMEVDPEVMSELRERMDQLNHLLHKHQANSVEALIVIRDKFDAQVQAFDSLEDEIAELQQLLKSTEQRLSQLAEQLHKKRSQAVPAFEKEVNRMLGVLKMEHASFKVAIESLKALNSFGLDQVHFLFAPNKGSTFAEIREVASGGEISRLSLITKSLVAGSLQLPTLIFDEIDSGVSGDVAKKMGDILARLSERHQIISITHSPQVAAKGDRHFRVFKTSDDDSTLARVSLLAEAERIEEIATMLSSSPPSEAALASARELIAK